MASNSSPPIYNDTSDGSAAPRSIEEALEFTLKSTLFRGVQELKEIFPGVFSDETIASALLRSDLSLENAVLYLQELTKDAAESPRSESAAVPSTEPEELDAADGNLYQKSEAVEGEWEGITGIALDFSYSPVVDRPSCVKVFYVPDEVVRTVFVCLGGKEVIAMSRVCRSWSNIEKQYSSLYRRDCLSIWSRFYCKPETIEFPFPFNSTEALWGEGFPGNYKPSEEFVREFRTWRNMFITRPRVCTDGVYVSKTKYLRKGATEGAYTNPLHVVVYYRYFRFYPDFSLVCQTTSDRPSVVLPSLCHSSAKSRLGEWSFREKELLAHAVEGTSVYSYRFLLTESDKHRHDLLRLQESWVRSSTNLAPLRVDTAGNSFPRLFRFFKL